MAQFQRTFPIPIFLWKRFVGLIGFLNECRRRLPVMRWKTPGWLEKVGLAPFDLRLLKEMLPPVPAATVRVSKDIHNRRDGVLEIDVGRVTEVKNWNRKLRKPI
ncbi:hypothetical protein [Noviherbaspirillum sp. ST9]|uniref:hypothetical protein n=1 Tax=Noviherbaspirillum sp. ST9 TaxID=3401606 RepID=UPI003B588325